MRLQKLYINNFLSYKELTLEIPKDKNIVGIIGKNGAGKSSLLEAIPWCLYGKTNRNSLERHIPNIQDPKKAKVTLIFDNELVVERQKNPPLFSYIVNNELIRSNTITDTQSKFDSYTNSSYKSFSVNSFFDDILSNSFILLSAEDKRQIVTKYFDLEEFLELRKLIKSSFDNCKKNIEYFEFLRSYVPTDISNLIKEEQEDKKYYDFWIEALADNGIIKNNLDPLFYSLTEKINKYLKLLFDEEIFFSISSSYEIYLKISDMELGPKSISSSQGKRLNLAIMLALSELHKELKHPKLGNILILDEFSGLDSFSKEKLASLIHKLSQTNQIFFVTHDEDLLSLINPLILEVTMENNLSQVKIK